jgi:hypothetical protein
MTYNKFHSHIPIHLSLINIVENEIMLRYGFKAEQGFQEAFNCSFNVNDQHKILRVILNLKNFIEKDEFKAMQKSLVSIKSMFLLRTV